MSLSNVEHKWLEYTKVCDKIFAYQFSSPDGFSTDTIMTLMVVMLMESA